MSRITVALVAGAAVLSASAAFAADLSVRRQPPPLAPFAAPPVFNPWTGCYIGGFIGGAWGGDVQATEAASTGGAFPAGTLYNAPFGATYTYELDSSFIGGGTVGCNFQFNGLFVVGVEGEAGYLRLRGSAIDPNSVVLYGSDTVDSTTVGDWYGVIAARFGVAFGPALIYGKAGAAFIRASSTIVDTCVIAPCGAATLSASGSSDQVTWAVGAGIEYALGPSWSIKAEYLHLGLDRDYTVCGPGGAAAAGSTFCSTHNVDGIDTVKLGVNFRFGGGPLIPRY